MRREEGVRGGGRRVVKGRGEEEGSEEGGGSEGRR